MSVFITGQGHTEIPSTLLRKSILKAKGEKHRPSLSPKRYTNRHFFGGSAGGVLTV